VLEVAQTCDCTPFRVAPLNTGGESTHCSDTRPAIADFNTQAWTAAEQTAVMPGRKPRHVPARHGECQPRYFLLTPEVGPPPDGTGAEL
jgi:hypothetical protein